MMPKRWTDEETRALLNGIGVYGVDWFQRNCGDSYPDLPGLEGRSGKACYAKASRLFGEGGLTRASFSMRRIMRDSGYSKSQVQRAMKALRQKWKRLSPKHRYMITEDQYDEIMDWLGVDYWSTKHRLYNCHWCHKTTHPHKGSGLCEVCYSRYSQQIHRKRISRVEIEAKIEHSSIDEKAKESALSDVRRGMAMPECFFDLIGW